MRRLLLLPACAALLLAPAGAAAQWTVEAAAGRALHDPVSARVAAASASLGLGWSAGERWGYLAAGAPLDGGAATWGAAGAGARAGVRRGAARLGVVANAHAFAYGAAGPNAPGTGGSALLAVEAGTERGAAAATVYAGAAAAGERADSVELRRFADFGAGLSVAVGEGVTVGGDARLLRGEGGEWPFVGAGIEVARPRGGAWVRAGAWLAAEHPAPAEAWEAGARLHLGGATMGAVALRQEPFDPLHRSTPRRSWTVSLTRRLGDGPGGALAPRLEGGAALFRLPRDGGAPPVLIGDFTGWAPVPMAAEGRWWVARVRLAPGVHYYAFRTADGRVVVPAGVPAVDDGFGGRSAVLVVP